ncbi:CoA pyrophosphatase [Marispirochaeta sp.]|uniref:NUDIX hydrolase n=1 Tax=Marispirochaeta sp. TaxID=2038653 RepID=UPI0029C68306|nr:CoA pyrophosphatase [Marispirochaeta sp.]
MINADRSFPAGIEDQLYNTDHKRLTTTSVPVTGLSAVLFLLTYNRHNELSLVLTKRSPLVSQPGDLCSPGGRIAGIPDHFISSVLLLPRTPLRRWRNWQRMRREDPRNAARLALIVSAALRESWEEIRLNPFRVRLLGTLSPRQLSVFDKTIYPICAWTRSARGFKASREVESIHLIPVSQLLDPRHYAAYSIRSVSQTSVSKETICYRHSEGNRQEILWGATLDITLSFLKTIYNFEPPARNTMPLVEDVFTEEYFS